MQNLCLSSNFISENNEGKQEQDGQPPTVEQQTVNPQQQQQVRPINPIPARRMMWPGARPRFMGARPVPPPVANQQSYDGVNGHQVPVAPMPFCPYPVPPFVGQHALNQAVAGAEEKAGESKGPSPAQRGRGRGRPRGAMMGRPHGHSIGHNVDAGDAAAVQHAMAAYWLIWSWLTQLHNTYDLNITLSVKQTSTDEAAQSAGDTENDAENDESTTEDDKTKEADENATKST